jgi:hypothetical protein
MDLQRSDRVYMITDFHVHEIVLLEWISVHVQTVPGERS